jgi:hypothetical protein
MKLPDAPFIYLVLLTRRGGAQDKCELLDKGKIVLGNAVMALEQDELPHSRLARGYGYLASSDANVHYVQMLQLRLAMGRTTHYAYFVGADQEHPTDDILDFMRELPPVQRADYLIDKDW